jgi:hypothetical protein
LRGRGFADLYNERNAGLTRVVERRVPVAVARLGVGAMVQQQTDCLKTPFCGSVHERCNAKCVHAVHVYPSGQQCCDLRDIIGRGGLDKLIPWRFRLLQGVKHCHELVCGGVDLGEGLHQVRHQLARHFPLLRHTRPPRISFTGQLMVLIVLLLFTAPVVCGARLHFGTPQKCNFLGRAHVQHNVAPVAPQRARDHTSAPRQLCRRTSAPQRQSQNMPPRRAAR